MISTTDHLLLLLNDRNLLSIKSFLESKPWSDETATFCWMLLTAYSYWYTLIGQEKLWIIPYWDFCFVSQRPPPYCQTAKQLQNLYYTLLVRWTKFTKKVFVEVGCQICIFWSPSHWLFLKATKTGTNCRGIRIKRLTNWFYNWFIGIFCPCCAPPLHNCRNCSLFRQMPRSTHTFGHPIQILNIA